MRVFKSALVIFFILLFALKVESQFNCSDNKLYCFRPLLTQSVIVSWVPTANGFNSNTLTNCPVGTAGLFGGTGGLTLMPNISGGTVSPTFFTTQYGAIYYWNGAAWVPNGSTFGGGAVMGMAGCASGIYASYLTASGQKQIKKFTPPSTVTTLFNFTMTVGAGVVCDCDCNFYLLGTSALYKYDPNGNLLATYNFVGTPFLVTTVTRFGIVGNQIYVVNANNASYAISNGVGTLTGNSIITSSMTNAAGVIPIQFASCPFSMPVFTSINSSTLLCNPATATIAVSSTPSPLNYTWTGPGVVPPATGSLVNVNLPGTYSCVVKNGYCTDTVATLVSTVVSNITTVQPTILPGNNLCFDPNLILNSSITSNLYSYKWLGPGLGTQNTGTSVIIPGPGLYSLTVTQNDNGCYGIATSSILSQPVLDFSVSTPTLCVYSLEGKNKAILTYGGATQYTLLVSPGFSLQLSPSQPVVLYQTYPLINGGSAGSATIIGSNGACTGSTTTNFSVLPAIDISVVPQSSLVCTNGSVTIHASGAKKFVWFKDDKLLPVPLDSIVSVNVSGNSYVSVTGVDPYGCNTAPKTVSLGVFPLNDGVLNYRGPICAPACVDLKFEAFNDKYNKIFSSWTVNSQKYTAPVFKHCFAAAGQYTFSGILRDSLHSCTNTVQIVVRANAKPEADFIFRPKAPVEGQDEVFFTNTSSGDSLAGFNWYFNDNKGYTSKSKDVSYLYMQPGEYKVAMVVSNQWKCADTILKVISVDFDFGLYVPNAFTPNGDERNDIFLPVMRSVKKYDLKIYDRWGKLLFQTTNPAEGWDGTYGGVMCKQDVYTWKIQLYTIGGQEKIKTGKVTMLAGE